MGKPRAPSLTSISYESALKAFNRAGFKKVRQKGSHIVLAKDGHANIIVLPAHRPVAIGTLKQCIAAAGLTPESFYELL